MATIHKSFKYDDVEQPKVHAWFMALEDAGKGYSEALRRLIEGDVRERDRDRDRVLDELAAIRKQIAGVRLAGVAGPVEEAALIEIEEIEGAVREVEEKVEVKTVDKGLLKSRYGL
jgi:hypothetical protein